VRLAEILECDRFVTLMTVIGTLGIKPKAIIGRDRISRRISMEP
jgi:hypothetical protein